jgi:dTDP-4-amino-4,6-dideoxygalactose transaminase
VSNCREIYLALLKLTQLTLTVAEKACSKVLAFPHHQHLKKNQILYVCEKIRDFYKKN